MDNITHDFVIMSKNGWFSSAKESIDIAIDAIRDAILEKKTTASFEIFYAGEVKQYLNAVFGGVFDITYANRVKAHVTVRINLDYITMPTSDYVDVCRAISNTKQRVSGILVDTAAFKVYLVSEPKTRRITWKP